MDWLRRLVSYWADEFDWRAWEQRLNALDHFTWEGIHFVHQRAASGRGVPLILTHGWPSSFLDYVDMLPMLERLRRGRTLPARVWILAASSPGRHQLSIRLGALAPAHV